jgi:thiamine-phosphate pyrophosphorylase
MSLAEAKLYGIVDLGYVAPDVAVTATEALIAGGVDLIQLRAKGQPVELVADLARKIHGKTSVSDVPLIINDYPALLREVPAEGAHVGQDDQTVAEARAAAGRPCLIGKSTHSVDQAVAAAAEGADYIGFGPLFATPTKPGRPAIGLDDIQRLYELVQIPIFCIGGIKVDNLPQVVAAGARRVVIVSGWLQAIDVPGAVNEARAVLDRRGWPA